MVNKIRYFLLFIFIFVLLGFTPVLGQSYKINFNYLNTFRKSIYIQGKKIVVWEAFSEKHKNSDVPGVKLDYLATTDGVAEVALLYLTDYERFGFKDSLDRAYEALEFLLYMQEPDGSFSPFIYKSGLKGNLISSEKINLGTAKAFWAIAYGRRIFKSGLFTDKLQDSLEKTLRHLQRLCLEPQNQFGNYKVQQERKIPFCLLNDSGRITSLVILGLCEYYKSSPREDLSSFLKQFCQGLVKTQWGNFKEYPFYVFLDEVKHISMREWVDHYQVMALAKAGKMFNNGTWLRTAENEASSMYTHMVASTGFMSGWYPQPEIFPQRPEALESLVSNLVTLYQVTKKKQYIEMAGLLATWLLGDNILKKPMYLSSSGKCFSELKSTGNLAPPTLKSTVAALKVFVLLDKTHGKRYINYTGLTNSSYLVFKPKDGIPVESLLEERSFYTKTPGGFILSESVYLDRGDIYWHRVDIKREDDYYIYLVFTEQPGSVGSISATLRIDGGKFYTVNMSEPLEEPFKTMKKLPDLFSFDLGLHSIGVRYSGLLYSRNAIVDCLIIQPQIEYKLFKSTYNQYLLFLRNFSGENTSYKLSTRNLGKVSLKLRAFSSRGFLKKDLVLRPTSQDKEIEIPIYAYGCTLVGWQAAKEQRKF